MDERERVKEGALIQAQWALETLYAITRVSLHPYERQWVEIEIKKINEALHPGSFVRT